MECIVHQCMNITNFQIITSYIFCVRNDSSVGWPWLICSQLTLPQVYKILCLLRVPKFKVVISRYQDLSISWPTFVSSYSCVKLFKGMVKFKIVILANLHIVILLSGLLFTSLARLTSWMWNQDWYELSGRNSEVITDMISKSGNMWFYDVRT